VKSLIKRFASDQSGATAIEYGMLAATTRLAGQNSIFIPTSKAALIAEHRKEPRTRTLKGATITFRGRTSVIDCTVRNLSPNGACLEVVSQNGIPDSFELLIDTDKSVHSCCVAWRKASRIGVEFQKRKQEAM
jgi:hypothetical protein